MKLKKVISLLLCAALALGAAGCSQGSDSSSQSAEKSGEAKKLTVWAWDDNFNVKAANIAKQYYQKKHADVSINVVSMALDDIRQKMNTAFAAENYDGMPNVVLVEDYSIGGYLQSFPGVMRDLSSIVKKDDWMSYKINAMMQDGKIYGVPFDSGVTGMFYRTDYLQKAGYTAQDMQNITWDKYIEIGKKVKEKTGVSMLQMTSGDLTLMKIMLQSAGSWYVKDDGKTLNITGNKALEEGLKTYQKLVKAGIVTNLSGWDAEVQAIQQGKLATIVDGCWIAPTIQTASDQNGKWALAPTPRMTNVDGSANASNVGGASWYVIDKVDGAATAEDFLKETFDGNVTFLNELVKEINLVSTYKHTEDFSNYKTANPFFSGQTIYQDFNKWAGEVPTVNYGINTYAIDSIVEESIQSVTQGADIPATMKSIEQRAAALG